MNIPTALKPFICFMLMLALLPLTGCAPSQEQIAAQTATAQTAVAALWTPTLTATATATATPVPPSATPTVTLTSTQPPEPTAPPASSGPLTSLSIKDVTFSFVTPQGWEKGSDPRAVTLVGPTAASIQLYMAFDINTFEFFGTPMEADETGIPMYAAFVQDDIKEMTKDLVQVSEDFLVAADGKSYFRWVMEHNANGIELHQTIYILGSGKSFLTVIYSRPKSAGAENDAPVDAAVKTLTFAR